MTIKVDTLGGLRILKGGEEYPQLLSQKRRCALLVYLGMEGEATREALLGLFWPEREPDRARHSLSQALYEIRRACDAACLETHGEFVRANRSVLELDAYGFQRAVEEGRYAEAIPLYGGAFLDGVHLADTAGFEHWADQVRARLRRRHRKARSQLIEELASGGSHDKAMEIAREWAELEPLEDEAQHAFIRLLAGAGRRSEALKQYDSFARSLAKDDLEPLDDTKELVGRIKRGDDPGSPLGELSPAYGGLEAGPPAAVSEPAVEAYRGPTAAELETSHPWIVRFAHAVRNNWVFRIGLGYAAALFVGLQIADPFNLPDLLLRQLTAAAVALFPIVILLAWAMEPSVRRYRKGGPDAARASERVWGLFTRRGIPVGVVAVLTLATFGSWWPGGGVTGGASGPTVTARRYPIAILPILAADSTDRELTAFAGNLTRALIDHFYRYGALEVRAEREVRRYRDPASRTNAITRDLVVDHLVSGDVARGSEGIEIHLQMTDSSAVLWSHVFPNPAGQSAWDRAAIANVIPQLTEELRAVLGQDIEDRGIRLGTDEVEAWRMVQRGRELSNQAQDLITAGGFTDALWAIDQADSLFREASELDESWAEPHTRRAHLAELRVGVGFRAYFLGAPGGMATAERNAVVDEGIARANRALELSPGNPDALERRGALHSVRRALGGIVDPIERARLEVLAERDFRQALAGDRFLTRARSELGVLFLQRGAYEDALEQARMAYEQRLLKDNLEETLNTWAMASFELGDEGEALTRCREGLERFPVQGRMFGSCELTVLAFGTEADPDPNRAWELGDLIHPGLLDSHPESSPLSRSTGALIAGVLARANLADSARGVLARVHLGQALEQTLLNEAGTLARLGEYDAAVAALEEYLVRTRGVNPDVLLRTRRLAPLRGYPPYEALLTSRP